MFAVKPLSAFVALDKAFSPVANRITLLTSEKLLLNTESPKVTVVRQGIFKIDRTREELLVTISPAPAIIDLPGVHLAGQEVYQITALTACEVYQLEMKECLALLNQHQIWREAFEWVSWLYRVLEQRDVHLIGKSSYSQIRATLHHMSRWEPSLRAKIGVMAYIQQRTRISRSVIAEVLAALRAGNYIEMEKGKLVTVNRLPREY